MDNYIIGFLLGVIFLGFLLFLLRKRKPRLSPKSVRSFVSRIEATKKLDPAHSLLESHKIFIQALKPLAKKKKTAAEVVKIVANYLPNKERIWYFHRMRNRAAHEVNFNMTAGQAQDARNNFIRALKSLR